MLRRERLLRRVPVDRSETACTTLATDLCCRAVVPKREHVIAREPHGKGSIHFRARIGLTS
jgi:hypothetical protein